VIIVANESDWQKARQQAQEARAGQTLHEAQAVAGGSRSTGQMIDETRQSNDPNHEASKYQASLRQANRHGIKPPENTGGTTPPEKSRDKERERD
jgi:hypothetical protein